MRGDGPHGMIFVVAATMTATMTATRTSHPPRTRPHSRGSAGRPAVRVVRAMTAGMTGMTRAGLKSRQLEGKLCCRRSSEKVTDYFQL